MQVVVAERVRLVIQMHLVMEEMGPYLLFLAYLRLMLEVAEGPLMILVSVPVAMAVVAIVLVLLLQQLLVKQIQAGEAVVVEAQEQRELKAVQVS
jgi:hypothetical protein